MANIAFYSDSFGWGHITRDVAFLREWAEGRPGDKICWMVAGKVGGICKKMATGHKNILVRGIGEGISFVPDGAGLDLKKSRAEVLKWFERTGKIEQKESEFLKKEGVDLVFSDVRPEAFNAAKSAGLPSFAISNFSWALVCKKNWEEEAKLHEYLEGAYSLADISFILPLCEPCGEMANRVKSPFLARKISRKIEMKKGHGKKYALINFGKSAHMINFKVPEGIEKVEFPQGDTESQNYVPHADFVVSKASYGICSEAVQAKVPCMLSARAGFEESRYVLEQMVQNGWGVKMGGEIDFSLLGTKKGWKKAGFGFYEFAAGRLEGYLRG
ncbi:MAG: hypothetical protein V1822_01705 [Candidatus Micrarchaeota archaeon]